MNEHSGLTPIWANPQNSEVPLNRVFRIDADPADMLKDTGNEETERSYDDADPTDSCSGDVSSGPLTNARDTSCRLNTDFAQTGRRLGGGGGAGPLAHFDGDVQGRRKYRSGPTPTCSKNVAPILFMKRWP